MLKLVNSTRCVSQMAHALSKRFSSTLTNYSKRPEMIAKASMVGPDIYNQKFKFLPADAMIVSGERLMGNGYGDDTLYDPRLKNFDNKTIDQIFYSFYSQFRAAQSFSSSMDLRLKIPISEKDELHYLNEQKVSLPTDIHALQRAKRSDAKTIIDKISKLTNHGINFSAWSQVNFNGSYVATQEMIDHAQKNGIELITPYICTAKQCASKYISIGEVLKFDDQFYKKEQIDSVGLTDREIYFATKEKCLEVLNIVCT